ncbi:MAG: N-acetyl-gamma-glutamyl-phosphate reductase [Gammaproteobacteria bacterium]|nr:N-acetyl-gamma-glutamyl-phosphate reductase [Gammaproteobacteria bacterium]
MSLRVFIDGQAGTTGLELVSRLRSHARIDLLAIEENLRKDASRRQELFAEADVVVLCLPDEAAREAVELAPDARFLDASTAHRTSAGWVYGLPELEAGQRQAIRSADRVANPGCYPTGFVLSVRPLIDGGLLSPDVPLRVNAVSGFSGGGKSMIAKYAQSDSAAWRHRAYGLDLNHKHVPEMRRYANISHAPLFTPAVGHYRSGMLVQVGLFATELERGAAPVDVHRTLAERYAGEPFVHVHPYNPDDFSDDVFLSPTARNGTNHLDLMVFGNDDHVLIATRYDNLGKGAAAAAVQNLNLMLGLPETAGLCGGANA